MKPFLDAAAASQQESLQTLITTKDTWASIVDVAGKALKVYNEIGGSLRSWANSLGNAQIFQNAVKALDEGFAATGGVMKWQAGMGPVDAPAAAEQLPAITVRGDRSRPLPSLTPAKAKASGAEKTDPVETYINSLKKQTAAEETEARALGLGNKAKQEAIDLAKAQEIASERGRPLTTAETEEIKKQADAYVTAKQQIDVYNRAQEDAKGQAEFFGQTLESAFSKLTEPGARLVDVLKTVAQALEQAALKALILGEGPLAGLMGTAAPVGATGASAVGGLAGLLFSGFSGFHANGGSIGAGKWGIAGEAGAEIISGPATVTPVAQINAALASGGGRGFAFTNAPTYHITPAQGVTPGQLAAVLKGHEENLNRTIGERMRKWDKRFG